MKALEPKELRGHGVGLEPMGVQHVDELRVAAEDGELWRLFFTFVPRPEEVGAYVAVALEGQAAGHMLPWVVRDQASGRLVGSTRYHDIVASVGRVEIGYTWYRPAWQRTHVNTASKLLLLEHAFDTVGCGVVGLRTDGLNLRSQRAIEGIGAKRDGTIRHFERRRDGSVRDTVMFSILSQEWPAIRSHLETRLWRHGREASSQDPAGTSTPMSG